jgi:60 kDa SS-A/Ro ribonucleoprotein
MWLPTAASSLSIAKSLPHGSTLLGKAGAEIDRKSDLLIVSTDEQSHDTVSDPKGRGTMVNAASYRHGSGTAPGHARGFAGDAIAWIAASEQTMH